MLGYNLIAVLSSTRTAGFDGFGPFWGFDVDGANILFSLGCRIKCVMFIHGGFDVKAG